MSYAVPTFSPEQFELRGYTNPFLTAEQQTAVSLVETRVNNQLDWVAQLLGWNGPNYWTNLATTVDQKRQLLTGTYGVYNSFFIPKIVSIQNWDNIVVVEKDIRIQVNQRVYLNQGAYRIQSFTSEGDKYYLNLGVLPDQFYTDIANNFPLEVVAPQIRPAPFYRPSVGISGDQSFVCGSNGTQLTLYPSYDVQKRLPYKFNIFFAGSLYYFNQNVYVTYDGTTKDIVSTYDENLNLWYLQVPDNLTLNQVGLSATLVWPQYDPLTSTTTLSTTLVSILNWSNPSDWNNRGALENFIGTWGNKGGFLPFNFVFDALSLHGFNEENSLFLAPVTREIDFNSLLQYVYYQQIVISSEPPPVPNIGDVWWNTESGAFSIWYSNNNCGSWIEINYRDFPDFTDKPGYLYATVADFETARATLPLGAYALIANIQGLNPANEVIGIQGTIPSTGALYLYKADDVYWMPYKFEFIDETEFNDNALQLPYKIPTLIENSNGLSNNGTGKNYSVSNLTFEIGTLTEAGLPATVTKYYTNRNWVISPDSIVKYIAKTKLFPPVTTPPTTTPLQGEAWWDYDNTIDANERTASLYYQDAWVEVNQFLNVGNPPQLFNVFEIVVYCNGVQLQQGVAYRAENYTFSYTVNPTNGQYTFTYTPFNFSYQVQLPVITLSDSLTSEFRYDISNIVFSGLQYYMSPNVRDAETTLRLWKAQALQVVENLELLERQSYINPLRADINSGPGPENWEKFFVRLSPSYQRDGTEWQKVLLTCQDFTNQGSTFFPEEMDCPPEDDTPLIYEELFLLGNFAPNRKFIYTEPYLYSNIGFFNFEQGGPYENAGVYPTQDAPFDEFQEAELVEYEPLHSRQADVTSPVGQGYGDWEGIYLSIENCIELSGFVTNDLVRGAVTPLPPPVWDASIYKYAPTCNNAPESYFVDANHYKVGYAYFAADLSAAEEGFFDVQQEYAWRFPQTQPKTGYLTPTAIGG
jgi:hypothetical protein